MLTFPSACFISDDKFIPYHFLLKMQQSSARSIEFGWSQDSALLGCGFMFLSSLYFMHGICNQEIRNTISFCLKKVQATCIYEAYQQNQTRLID